MTVAEALAQSAAHLDDLIEHQMSESANLLMEHGATAAELTAELTRFGRELEEWKAATLQRLRRWLLRGGETLH